ncbi:hypothetical protein SAMN06295967_10196 [Belliella buryatensis]|uniref:Uncharacterized protein n=1 Tax=Belliella buryatensis TaxID=1500549 RepID=A0A239AGG0_9BACT|nr:hypothetical protein SAMN06295967_10196 [Belliella buryatensis]
MTFVEINRFYCIFNKKTAMNEDKQFRLLLAISSVVWLVLIGFIMVM